MQDFLSDKEVDEYFAIKNDSADTKDLDVRIKISS